MTVLNQLVSAAAKLDAEVERFRENHDEGSRNVLRIRASKSLHEAIDGLRQAEGPDEPVIDADRNRAGSSGVFVEDGRSWPSDNAVDVR